MNTCSKKVIGWFLIVAAVTVQATRLLGESAPAGLLPAVVAITWLCLLAGTALIASTRKSRDDDSA